MNKKLQELREKFKSESVFKNHESYMQNKIDFLFYNYDKVSSINTYWRIFKNNILPVELDFNKDLYNFSADEVKQLMLSTPVNTPRLKNGVWSLSRLYVDWALKVAKLGNNPINHFGQLISSEYMALKDEYISWDDMFEIADRAILKGTGYQEVIIPLLLRMGVYGGNDFEYLRELREHNIKKDVGSIMITDEETGEILTKIPIVDDRIYKYIDNAITETEFIKINSEKEMKHRVTCYQVEDKILKPRREDDDTLKRTQFYQAINNIFELSGRTILPPTKLIRCAKLDMLNEIYRYKGVITSDDFKMVQKIYEPYRSVSSHFTLKQDFKLLYPNIEIKNIAVLRREEEKRLREQRRALKNKNRETLEPLKVQE